MTRAISDTAGCSPRRLVGAPGPAEDADVPVADPLEPTLVTPHLDARAVSAVRVGADGTATLVVLVTPKPRMHVYSADVDGYVPFTLTTQPQPGMSVGKVAYPSSETLRVPADRRVLACLHEAVQGHVPLTFAAEARARAQAAPPRTPGVVTLRYQACDDAVCYRPTTGSFVFEIIRKGPPMRRSARRPRSADARADSRSPAA